MKIKNAKRDQDGEWSFDMTMEEGEVSFLVELSVTSLLKVGIINIEEQEEEQDVPLTIPQQNAPSTGAIQ